MRGAQSSRARRSEQRRATGQNLSAAQWMALQQIACEFSTVEEFWTSFEHLPPPSTVFFDGKSSKRVGHSFVALPHEPQQKSERSISTTASSGVEGVYAIARGAVRRASSEVGGSASK